MTVRTADSTSPAPPHVSHAPPVADTIWSSLRRKLLSFNIGHLLLLLLGLHLFAVSFPSEKGLTVFDEFYYVKASKDLLNLVASNVEHPFFGKVFGALGIYLFGDNFFGWRIFPVIFGVLSVYLLYELARLFLSREKALFAASLLGFETLFFIHTSLLLLEGPPIFFALLASLLYFKRHYNLTIAALGLSILSKEWGIYFVAALVMYHLWSTKPLSPQSLFKAKVVKQLVAFIAILVLVVGLPLWGYDYIYHPYSSSTVSITPEVIIISGTTISTTITTHHFSYLTDPLQNFIFYYNYQSSLTGCGSTSPWNCYPWNWILPFNITPIHYYQTGVAVSTIAPNGTEVTNYVHPIDWQGIGNLTVWYGIWIIVPTLIVRVVTKRTSQLDRLVGSWIAATYLPSWYISLVVHRVEYAFYFLNVDPALVLGIPMVISYIAPNNMKIQRIILAVWLAAAIIFFVLYFPVRPLDFK